jgi:5-methylthioribose kinase
MIQGEPDYGCLEPHNVVDYVAAQPELASLFDPAAVEEVVEVGDGNLNLVFIVRCKGSRGLVLKQALPYLRLVGPSWPLTADRARHEAETMMTYAELAPAFVPKIYHFDARRHIIAMEDLSDHVVWRTALNRGERHEGVAHDLGALIARVAFGTSIFGMDAREQKLALARSVNPELCAISEDLVFTEPYVDAGRNRVLKANQKDADDLAADEGMVQEIGWLKWQFMTQAETLLHGDLHTGSVMVNSPAAGTKRSTKVIDSEFAFYGPTGFDIGALWGNYVIAAARAFALAEDTRAYWCLALVRETWRGFEEEFSRLWPHVRDPRVFGERTREHFTAKVYLDSWGFAAAKAARRVVGLAKASDIETLDEEVREGAARGVLRAARLMARARHTSSDPDGLVELVGNVLTENRTNG